MQRPLGLGRGHELVGRAGPDVGLDAELEGRELGLLALVVLLPPALVVRLLALVRLLRPLGALVARGDDDVDWFARVPSRFVPVQSPALLGREAEDDESVHDVRRVALVDEGAERGVALGETGVVDDGGWGHAVRAGGLVDVVGGYASGCYAGKHQGAVDEESGPGG